MTHLIVALSTKGYGETILGLRIANELHGRGDQCAFLAHSSSASLFTGTPFQYTPINDHSIGLLKVSLLVLLKKLKPASILLSDYFTTALACERAQVEPGFFRKCGVPVGAIDTWDLCRTGTTIDVFGTEHRTFADWSEVLSYRLVPVPFVAPVPGAAARYYSCLPQTVPLTLKIRRHIRRDLGIADSERCVLFCTAGWQHAAFDNTDANRLARTLPWLIGAYLSALGERVHLVHVGPSAFPIELDGRYHWLPPLSPADFDLLVASADLLLAANASSATIAKALVCGVPSAVLVNSRSVRSAADVDGDGSAPGRALTEWLRTAAPVYPFFMWPIGYHAFLAPLLADNPYTSVVPMLEIMCPDSTVATLRALLFDERRKAAIEAQRRYVAGVCELPGGGTLVSEAVA